MQYHFNPLGFIEEKLHALHGDTTVSLLIINFSQRRKERKGRIG